MTDDEHAAALCSIAYSAMLSVPHGSYTRLMLRNSLAEVRNEIARPRNCTPEDIQNEFEGKGR